MFKNIRAVLFDLDGTLVDSAPDLGAAADKMRCLRHAIGLWRVPGRGACWPKPLA